MRYQAMTGFAVVNIQVDASTTEEAEQKVKSLIKSMNEHLSNLPDGVEIIVDTEDIENVEEIKE